MSDDKEREYCENALVALFGSGNSCLLTAPNAHTFGLLVDVVVRLRAAARAEGADVENERWCLELDANDSGCARHERDLASERYDALVAAAREASVHWDGDYHAGVKAIAAVRALLESEDA